MKGRTAARPLPRSFIAVIRVGWTRVAFGHDIAVTSKVVGVDAAIDRFRRVRARMGVMTTDFVRECLRIAVVEELDPAKYRPIRRDK